MGENKVSILPALEGDKTVLTQCVRTLSQTFAALLKLFGQYWINMVHSTVRGYTLTLSLRIIFGGTKFKLLEIITLVFTESNGYYTV